MSTTFNNNFVGHVRPRTDLEIVGGTLDKHGGVLFCSLSYPKPCPNLRITNNIVAGSVYVGFTAPAHDCNHRDPQVFRNNVAHSIDGGINGDGAVIYPDPSRSGHAKCYEGSHFAAYKVTKAGALTNFASKRVQFKHMTTVDVGIGTGAMLMQDGAAEYNEFMSIVSDSKFYGESPSPDCPDDKSFCYNIPKAGLLSSIHGIGSGIGMHPTMPSALPLSAQIGQGAWGARSLFKNLELINFKAKTATGSR